MDRKKKIVIIDDSAFARRLISDIIETREEFVVFATASNGVDGLDLLKTIETPDVVILDINMPYMSGLELLEELGNIGFKVPVLVVSTLTVEGAKETIRALELGALDFVTKPGSPVEAEQTHFSEKLLTRLDMVFSSAVSNKIALSNNELDNRNKVFNRTKANIDVLQGAQTKSKRIVAIASSTGGPKSLQMLIPFLKKNIDAPVLLVQHMPANFTASLAQRLDELSEIQVKEAENGDVLQSGVTYIAKGGYHMEVVKNGSFHMIKTNVLPPREGVRPCANYMFESLASSGYDEIICVVLTGMGQDGTVGIRNLKARKKTIVIAQDEESSVVFGMPRAIIGAGLADSVIPLKDIANEIMNKAGVLQNGR